MTGRSLWSQKLFHWRLCRNYCLCFRNKSLLYVSHQSVLSFCVTLARHNFSQSDSAGHGDRGGRMLMFGLQRPQSWVYFWEGRGFSHTFDDWIAATVILEIFEKEETYLAFEDLKSLRLRIYRCFHGIYEKEALRIDALEERYRVFGNRIFGFT